MAYSPIVLEHFDHPHNAGEYGGPEPLRVTGIAGERRAGAQVRLDLQVEHGFVRRAWFRAYGCPYTVAAASWITDWVSGRSFAEVAAIDPEMVARALEFPTEKLGQALLVEDALRACLAEWRRRQR